MKKLVALCLTAALCMGLAVPAFAADGYGPYSVKDDYENEWSFSSAKVETRTLTLAAYWSEDEEWTEENAAVIVMAPGSTLYIDGDEEFEAFDSFVSVNEYRDRAETPNGHYVSCPLLLDALDGVLPINQEMSTEQLFGAAPERVTLIGFYGPLNSQTGEHESIYMVLGDASAASGSPFTDVAADAYYADAVRWAVDKGVTAGTSATTFSPDDICTTAQILTFLWRANGSPAPAGRHAAVPAGQYYSDAVNWAYESGLISGSAFVADDPCTRSATVTYLWKLAGSPAADAAAFTNVPADAEYAQAVAWAVKEGVTAGTGAATFSPGSTCTRAQIVTFLYRDFVQ